MKKRKLILGVGALSALVAPIAAVIACNNGIDEAAENAKVIKLISDFKEDRAKISGNSIQNVLTSENESDYIANINKYLEKAQAMINKIGEENIYNKVRGVWLKTFEFKLGVEKQSYEAKSRWLGANPANENFQPLNQFYNEISWFVDTVSYLKSNDIEVYKKTIVDYIELIKAYKDNFKEALDNNVTFSGVYTRILISDLTKFFGKGSIATDNWTKDTENTAGTLLVQKFLNLDSSVSDETKNELKAELVKAINETNNFMKFMMNDYWKGVKYGISADSDHSVAFPGIKAGRAELETISENEAANTGYGLTQADLDTKDVGIGFTKDQEQQGLKIYNVLLKYSTTSNKTIEEVMTQGENGVASNASNMLEVAKTVYNQRKDDSGKWEVVYKFDTDGPGPLGATDITLSWDKEPTAAELPDFYKFLQAERFYNGRDLANFNKPADDAALSALIVAEHEAIAKERGFEVWKGKDSRIDNKDANNQNIEAKYAYVGVTQQLAAYYRFGEAAKNAVEQSFYAVKKDYTIRPIEFARRAIDGVGQYGNLHFELNTDPYYQLPKWSMSSVALHEAVPGHHFQALYFEEHKTKGAPSNFFSAFSEGWGLFSEWFGVAKDVYGEAHTTDGAPDNGVPKFDTGAKGPITNDEEAKKFQNGVYKSLVDYNALQYFGYLNEQQLRAMRMKIDPSVHSGDGSGTAGSGWSISDERKYMTDNSALGIGDKTSESKRYLQYVGQATSYYTGKTIMQDMYTDFYKYQATTSNGLTSEEEKQYFGSVLKNNDIPLDVLYGYVHAHNDFGNN